jgi:hypothetical protein
MGKLSYITLAKKGRNLKKNGEGVKAFILK